MQAILGTNARRNAVAALAGLGVATIASMTAIDSAEARGGYGRHWTYGPSCPDVVNDPPATRAEFDCIDEGFRVFTKETFEGNGRTCATCHIPSENYNIFPSTIKKLSRREKKLVFAPHVPGLENPTLIKKLALFNIAGDEASNAGDASTFDGDGDPETADPLGHHFPVFRSTMTVQGLAVTSKNDAATFPGTPLFPIECSQGDGAALPRVANELPQLGWSGDGAPGTKNGALDDRCRSHHGNVDVNADGTVRAFANGAIAQHNPKSLARIAKTTACPELSVDEPWRRCREPYDFRFATNDELDAMAAFQNWLGRRALSEEESARNTGGDNPSGDQTEFDVTLLDFKDPRVNAGRDFYLGPAKEAGANPDANPNWGAGCNLCHTNGGAHFNFFGGAAINHNFNSEVELGSDDIGLELLGVALPEDEGAATSFSLTGLPPGSNNFFQGAFNVQSLIEAPQKKAWFHNHRVVDDLEEAVAFYGGEDFTMPNGNPAIAFTRLEDMKFGNASGLPGTVAFPDGDGVEHLGAFLRALSAYYKLRDCERLVEETMARAEAGASTRLPALHCRFNLSGAARALAGSKLKSRPFLHVAWEAQRMALYVERAARSRSPWKLQRALTKITALKEAIATLPAPVLADAEAEVETAEAD